ncbi:unnamed protein product [Prorocentrum cordatum]|uniref:Uncharacterized protein n=1 Tax=Prorocentrum cordatum TaxID=2364126 RepID=A0ABN9WBF6_9DINO|nr:unnamed protein product [Polarella glacialis]
MAPLPPARWLAALALLEVRRTLGFMTAPGDEVVTKDVTGYRLMAWAWLSLLVAYLVVSLVYGVFRFVNNRRVKPTAKFVGPTAGILSPLSGELPVPHVAARAGTVAGLQRGRAVGVRLRDPC